MKKETDWFIDWFNTPYYHLLYNHRNKAEAEFFMKNLTAYLNLKKGDCILDLPCGKGRHSIFLNKLGFDVVGADLSANSIKMAKIYENKSLKFSVHDMRNPIKNTYHAIFNLFTSFGYFNDEETNVKVLKNFKKALKPNGHIVIDFLNIKKTEEELVEKQIVTKENITFNIEKYIKNNYLFKDIYFNAEGKKFHYTEKLQYITLDKLMQFAERSHLSVQDIFGNYHLDRFDIKSSERLIMILK